MSVMLPHKLSHFNLFMEGRGFAGSIEEFTPPVLRFKQEDYQSGGMDMPVPIEMGMEKLEATFVMGDYAPEVFTLMGFRAGLPVGCIVRGALKKAEAAIPVTITLRGEVLEVDMGKWKRGDNINLTFKMICSYYRLDHNLVNLIEIDVLNMVRRIGPVDQLKAVRDILMI